MPSRRSNLVFSSVGDRSQLERYWLDQPESRNFDLWLCYYGEGDGSRFERLADRYFERKGSKFQNFHRVWTRHPGDLARYEAVFVIDDDIRISTRNINRLFGILYCYDLWILQPAFGSDSRVSHEVTRSQSGLFLRYTNFVEVNTPLFRRKALQKFLDYYDGALTGWGIDYLYIWANGVNQDRRYAVVDAVTCTNPEPPPGESREIDRLQSEQERKAAWYRYGESLGIRPWAAETTALVPEEGGLCIDVADLVPLSQSAFPVRVRRLRLEPGENGYLCRRRDGSQPVSLNDSAALVLSLCDGSRRVADIVEYLHNLYPGTANGISELRHDINAVLQSLADLSLVMFLAGATPAASLEPVTPEREEKPGSGDVSGSLRKRLRRLLRPPRRVCTVTVMTCDRNPSYLEQTLASIPDGLRREIVWQTDREITVSENVVRTPRLQRGLYVDGQANYAHCLAITTDGLIVEDDVRLSKDFPRHLRQVLKLLRGRDRYAVALYSAYNWNAGRTLELREYDVVQFYGTQAMLYDPVTAREFGRFLTDRLGVEPYDYALKSYCVMHDVPLYATSYSLVQHIGDESTGLGTSHRCENFIDDFSME